MLCIGADLTQGLIVKGKQNVPELMWLLNKDEWAKPYKTPL